ncbi:hypothetical protein GLOIN_2v1781950 [Rhizophagus irregularis DAOM 181602=DAOM 197198]|uniref:Uncharacterized protein n=2 Tax=Rhizophagus irregularis (strain DAOM 181602 / DAOM 197198 / MUCL 43194) TaxID=747089 RepID=A0A2P4PIN0_RHIID|nr:hypothetical protein GLOIN_2v1781950 [Rhizophagus irregularis DAOM 181602=DAOM 197198]POG65234.1 hypothetical protein GLOIN_2v1781950 [Rhizophagus irregularis DAOM 181602=DAOM 197198]|eukprot:XP_025172100.1 hypothetical protein GLOIN_2v1781950 [Rhizophagus irregularis DAOM 181602=DAOM 197198]
MANKQYHEDNNWWEMIELLPGYLLPYCSILNKLQFDKARSFELEPISDPNLGYFNPELNNLSYFFGTYDKVLAMCQLRAFINFLLRENTNSGSECCEDPEVEDFEIPEDIENDEDNNIINIEHWE